MTNQEKYYMEYCWIASACQSRLNGDAWRMNMELPISFSQSEEIMNPDESGNKKVNKMLEGVGGAWFDLPKTPDLGRPNKIYV